MGLHALKRGQRVPAHNRGAWTAKVAALYVAGGSFHSIAATLGRSYGWVWRIVHEAEAAGVEVDGQRVEVRGRGGSRPRHTKGAKR